MGFDIGKILGNFYLSYFSQKGHHTTEAPRDSYKQWILGLAEETWNLFKTKFIALWDQETRDRGEPASTECQDEYMRVLFHRSLEFAGCCMIRRIVGVAHVADLEGIEPLEKRFPCHSFFILACLHTVPPERNANEQPWG